MGVHLLRITSVQCLQQCCQSCEVLPMQGMILNTKLEILVIPTTGVTVCIAVCTFSPLYCSYYFVPQCGRAVLMY